MVKIILIKYNRSYTKMKTAFNCKFNSYIHRINTQINKLTY